MQTRLSSYLPWLKHDLWCQGTRSMLPKTACHPVTWHSTRPKTKDTQKGTKCKPTATEAQNRTPDCTHQTQTSTTCLVFGIFSEILDFLFFFFFIKITFVYFLFSAPDAASGICVHLSLFKVLSVSIYCSVPPHTSTNAEGQRLNRPKGSVRCSDSCQGLLCLLCMCERGLWRQWHHLLRRRGHRLMRSLADPWERQCVSTQ